MDPLSISASIAGLVTLADLVFRAALRYSKSVKEVPKEVKALLDEIKDLSLLLHNLSMVAYGFQLQPDPQNPATAPKPYHLHECQQLLNRLEKGLPDFEAQSGLNKLQSRLKWPFTTSDTKEILQAIGRHKQTITIALNSDSLTKLQLCLSRQEETRKEIRELKEQVRRVLDIETKISLNEKRQEVLSTFTKTNPRLDFETNKELRHPMTALWLTEGSEFAEWVSTDKARIWCSGIPGAGKSVIAGAIIDECLQRLLSSPSTAICYFFCTYRNPETILPCHILSTLCSQLALQHESAYDILETYHEELHPPHQLPGEMKLPRLIKMLHEMCRVFSRVYLIVDGLDECGDNTRDVVDSLSKVSLGAANKNINVAILSRDELPIRERIQQDFHWIEIEAHIEDIQLYVASEMDRLINEKELRLKDLSLKDEIVTKLVKGAKGMILRKIDTYAEESKQFVKDLLLLIVIKNDGFDSLALCEAISTPEKSDRLDEDEIVDEQEVLRWCGSLVRLLPHPNGRGKMFQFAHFTVQEFLESDPQEYPILKSYGISLERAKERLMLLALRFLTLKNFEQRPQADEGGVNSVFQIRKTRPFCEIASVCWWTDQPEEIHDMVRDHLCTLFSIQKTPNFCSYDVNGLDIVADLIRHGVPVEKEDADFFFDLYFDLWMDAESDEIKNRYNNGAPVLNLLDALVSIHPSSPQQMSAQIDKKPEVSFYDWTFEFARSKKLKIKKSLVKSTMTGDIGSRDLPGLIFAALRNNDSEVLETIYFSDESEQVGLFDPQHLGFSVLHTAIENLSLDCLKLSLKRGFDSNARDKNGLLPIHMCDDYEHEDYLCVLLKHGSNSLLLDNQGQTIWHRIAGQGIGSMLEVLIQQDGRDSALCIVSNRGDTPVCHALINGHRESVELLLGFCDRTEHWKCSKPIYRAAAKLGSAKVIQKLVEIGVQYDENNDRQGNPLHWVSPGSDLQCIEILKSLFSLDQRRELDSRTPFESLLLRILTTDTPLPCDVRVAMGLLSDGLVSCSKPLGALWSFWCSDVVPKTLTYAFVGESLDKLFTALLERGIASAYEEHFGRPALEPLAQGVCRNTISRLQHLTSKDPTKDPLQVFRGWNWFSQIFHLIADDAKHTDQLAKNPIMAQLLCEAIIHGDQSLVKLLLKLGADCHFRGGSITPFELACLPIAYKNDKNDKNDKNEQVLGYLLDHTTPEHLARDGSYTGLGPLHLTAGLPQWERGQYTSTDKLRCLLDAGANPNLPSSRFSPMTYHINRDSMETAEALLDARADPWLRATESFDSVLMAVSSRNWTFLTKLFGHSTLNEYPPQWNQVWTGSTPDGHLFRKANGLHIAALCGGINAFEFYLDNHLLTDLNVVDWDGHTPMHYAAWAGLASVVQFLVERGGNIKAKSKSGMTPLNLAVQKGRTDCVRALLVHGAGQQEGHVGYSPFVDAYYSANETIINLLKVHLGGPSADSSIMNAKIERKIASSLMLAIQRGDVDACQNLFDLGCHVDIEITPDVTPLMFAICEKQIPVVQWLLDKNATVSTISWNKLEGFHCTALHAALMGPMFNPLIGRLVAKYLEEQREFLVIRGNPFCLTLASGNTQGLVILLNEIIKNHKEIDLDTMLNPKLDEMNPEAPLHMAAQRNDLAAFEALVNAGADIEQRDYNGSSPLHIAAANNASSIANYLISLGARLNQRSSGSRTPILTACLTVSSHVIQLLLKGNANQDAVDDFGDNCLTLLTTSSNIRRGPPSISAFKALIDAGIDPFAKNKFGLDAARSILISETSMYLCYVLNRFPDFFNNRSLSWADVQPMYEIVMRPLYALSLSRHLRLIRSFLTAEEFFDLSDLSTPGKHTFFCSSVISGSVEAVRNFLKYGANIGHACPDHGTPLTTALTYCQFEVFKVLVRSGAKSFTDGFLATGVHFTEHDEKTKRWLLNMQNAARR
ncbi:ankyrin repeat [Fusarium beomiforme]|uniref:Ankyrin repeat n=1 Tax=Fusarium beomiforme TaxID=44412 RepID=A0A9P5A6G6_9HYPO|nr:ankyrin repeat [Fusarium beomiforme]